MPKKKLKSAIFSGEKYILKDVDVLNFVTKSATKAERAKFDIGEIYINAIVCKKCGDYVRSKHRHDMQYCKCKKCFVDGGSWYQRVGGDCISITEGFYD